MLLLVVQSKFNIFAILNQEKFKEYIKKYRDYNPENDLSLIDDRDKIDFLQHLRRTSF